MALALTVLASPSAAQVDEPPPSLADFRLGSLKPPGPDPLDAYNEIVKSPAWLLVLGKALFWDSSLGSDGQACASCHFNAGADPRIINQLSPGLRANPADTKFGGIQPASTKTASGQTARPNVTLKSADFPFHKLQDPSNRQSPLVYDTNDVVSSQGVFQGGFVSLNPTVTRLGAHDFCSNGTDGIFQIKIGGVNRQVRKVEPRNTPTVINAAFFDRNFWDGRANNVFNGVDPFGKRSPNARIFTSGGAGGSLMAERLELENMSAASQAVGPPLSDFEVACAGREWAHIGRKLLPRNALAGQKIAWTDSVFNAAPLGSLILGTSATTANRGLKYTYRQLVQAAIADEYWNAPGTFDADGAPDPAGFTHDERNFSLFFGLAIDAYERTLISNQTRVDSGNLTAREQAGFEVFVGQGKCANCHEGPLFSSAAVLPRQPEQRVERMEMHANGTALYDGGFYNIGVRPTQEDIGLGGRDPWGNPLSFTRQYVQRLLTGSGDVDPFFNNIDPNNFEVPFADPAAPTADELRRVAVDGAFKTPSLRNIALTAPYFHNGGDKSLDEVVEFYNRGGNRCGQDGNDTTGSGADGEGTIVKSQCLSSYTAGRGSNLDPDIQRLELTAQQKADLVAFMKALTDERVRCHRAPFDHPELIVTNGHKLTGATGRAADARLRLREVGAGGYPSTACAQNSGNLFGYSLIGTGKMLEPVQ